MKRLLFKIRDVAEHGAELWVVPEEGSRTADCAALRGGEVVEIRSNGVSRTARILSIPITNPRPREWPKFVVFPKQSSVLFTIGCEVLLDDSPDPNQSVQHNAGSRPLSNDSSASETPSSLGPRG
jgi:hypothetical protein